MSHELDDVESGPALDPQATLASEEHRNGLELIAGVWAEKHPVAPLPDDDRPGCELIDGKWVEKSMSSIAGVVEAELIYLLKTVVKANRLGFVFTESGMFELFPDQPKQWRRPDVSFVRFGRLPDDKVPAGRMKLAPDLAVEVISPSDPAEEVEIKLDEYLRADVCLVWIIYIPTKNVWAYRPDGTARLYRTTDVLSGEDVAPGLSVPVTQLFEGV